MSNYYTRLTEANYQVTFGRGVPYGECIVIDSSQGDTITLYLDSGGSRNLARSIIKAIHKYNKENKQHGGRSSADRAGDS